MSKIRVVEVVTQNGAQYGQINQPVDLVKAQEFSHAHTEQVTKDFLTQNDGEVSGCGISLSTLLSVNIAAGRVYQAGLQYESQNQTLTMQPAHEQFARVDVVMAVLSANAPINNEFLAFQQLRTEQELNAAVPPYPPTQFQRATERWNVAVLAVKTGVPSASPQPTAMAANEVALYQITVPANAANLQLANIGDVRKVASNLRMINSQVKSHSDSLATHAAQIQQALNFEQAQRDFSSVFGELGTKSLLQILQTIASKLLVLKYRFPTVLSGAGRCAATVNQLPSGAYVIDIARGTLVQFGDRFVSLEDKFAQISGNTPAENTTTGDTPISGGGKSAGEAHYANTSNAPEQTYQPLYEGETITTAQTGSEPTGNVIRINAPLTQKWLYLNYEGELFFRNYPEPSSSTECLLLRITPQSGAAPIIKAYKNIRDSNTGYSKTFVTGDVQSRQFDVDLAIPYGYLYVDAYGVKASDKSRYTLPLPTYVPPVRSEPFDQIWEVSGVASGDIWVVNLTIYSAL